MTPTAPITRYARVQEILDRAAGDSAADYGSRGRFWQLPLPEFLEVEIHGVRMIAPASPAPASCCCAHEATDTPPACPGRGATSGLIRGLRGQPPFDGSQFPRLPWGGQPVPEADIRFIADWIDDGCPADDHQISLAVDGTVTPAALTQLPPHNVEPIVRRFEVYTGSPNAYRYHYGELKQRMNLDCMSEAQVE
jgi:tyrosinase